MLGVGSEIPAKSGANSMHINCYLVAPAQVLFCKEGVLTGSPLEGKGLSISLTLFTARISP